MQKANVCVLAIIYSGVVMGANRLEYVGSMMLPVVPSGYNIMDVDVVSKLLNHTSLPLACGDDGKSQSGTCVKEIQILDNNIQALFDTSNRDLYEIYRSLFVDPNSYYGKFIAHNTLLDTINMTLFGDGVSPGELNDLLSMADGANQVSSVATSQANSFRNATKHQNVALKGFATNILNELSTYSAIQRQAMVWLIGNRTLVQQDAISELNNQVIAENAGMGTQAEENQEEFTDELNELSSRFVAFKEFTEAAISGSKDNVVKIKALLGSTVKAAPTYQKEFKAKQIGLVNDAATEAANEFQTQMTALRSDMQTAMTQQTSDTADEISVNHNEFVADAAEFQKDLANDVKTLTDAAAVAPAAVNSGAAHLVTQAEPLVAQVQTQLRTELAPLYFDVLNTLKQAQGLAQGVAAVKASLNAHVVDDRTKAKWASDALGATIAAAYASVRASFGADMDKVSTKLTSSISTKVAGARTKLGSILQGVAGAQSASVNQQTAQGATTGVQSDVSKTAADLTAARQQLAGDQAKVGLDSMVSIVGSALTDSQANLSVIQKAQIAAIVAAKGSLSDAQRAQLDTLYASVQAKKAEAAGRTFALTQDSYAAQTDALQLNSDAALAGQRLDGAIQVQTQQAASLLGEINDIMSIARQAGGTVEQQMSALEAQAPNMVAVLKQKIAQYKAIAVAQGLAARGAADAAVGGQAGDALGAAQSGLSVFLNAQTGIASDMVASGNGLATDASSLLSDLGAINGDLEVQASKGASLVQAKAQSAMSRSIAQMQSSGSDSAAALNSLLSFNQATINEKRKSILGAGDSAMDAALDAADYLTSSATAFKDISSKFVSDATTFGSKSQSDMSRLLNTVNVTLVAATRVADYYMKRVSDLPTDGLSVNVTAKATQIDADIHAQIVKVQAVILSMNGLGPNPVADLAASAANLKTFIDSLVSAFEKQRTAFNTYAQQYAIRRIASITGLSESVIASKAAFLSSLARSDITEGERASKTTDTLNALLASVQRAQGQSDMSQVAALIGGTTAGVGSLTASLTTSMNTDLSNAQQAAVNNAISAGRTAGNSVAGLEGTAGLIGNDFTNALDVLSKSQIAGQAAAAGNNKDVYAIAGLLKDTDQSTRLKVLALMKDVSAGKMSMDDAITSVQTVNSASVTSVEDILNAVAGFVAAHVSGTNAFLSAMNDEKTSVTKRMNALVSEHENLQAGMLEDSSDLRSGLASTRATLIDGAYIKKSEDARKAAIDALSNRLNALLYGDGTSSGSFAQLKHIRRRASALTDTISDLKFAVSSAKTAATQAQGTLDLKVSSDLTAANGVVQHIIDLTQAALQ